MFANICSYQKQQWIPLISSCWRAGDSFQTVCDTETVRTWKKPRALWRAALQKSSSPTQSEAPRNRRRWTAEKPESFYSFSSIVLWRGCLATGMDSARYHRKELPRAVTAKTQPPHNQLCCLPYKLWSHSKISSWIIPYLYKTTDQFFTNSSHCPDHTLYSALWVCPFTCKWAKTTQRCLTWLCHKNYSWPFHNLSFHRPASTSPCLEAATSLSLLSSLFLPHLLGREMVINAFYISLGCFAHMGRRGWASRSRVTSSTSWSLCHCHHCHSLHSCYQKQHS